MKFAVTSGPVPDVHLQQPEWTNVASELVSDVALVGPGHELRANVADKLRTLQRQPHVDDTVSYVALQLTMHGLSPTFRLFAPRKVQVASKMYKQDDRMTHHEGHEEHEGKNQSWERVMRHTGGSVLHVFVRSVAARLQRCACKLVLCINYAGNAKSFVASGLVPDVPSDE
jgi:hypothetical protein